MYQTIDSGKRHFGPKKAIVICQDVFTIIKLNLQYQPSFHTTVLISVFAKSHLFLISVFLFTFFWVQDDHLNKPQFSLEGEHSAMALLLRAARCRTALNVRGVWNLSKWWWCWHSQPLGWFDWGIPYYPPWNQQLAPKKMDGFGVLEDDPFPLGLGLFSGAMLLFFGGRVHTPKLT